MWASLDCAIESLVLGEVIGLAEVSANTSGTLNAS